MVFKIYSVYLGVNFYWVLELLGNGERLSCELVGYGAVREGSRFVVLGCFRKDSFWFDLVGIVFF